MMEDFEPIEIEFIINNPQLATDAKKAEQTLGGVSDSIQKQCESATQAISAQITAMSQELDALKIKAATADPFAVGSYTKQIKDLEAEMGRLRHTQEDLVTPIKEVEKTGTQAFEQVAQSAGKSTNYFKAAYSGLRQIAYALPGVGIAGLIAFATGPIIEYIAALIKGKDALNGFAQTMKAVNEVTRDADKQAASQITSLKLLYVAATDVKKSMDERLDAAQQLRETYPAEFANATNLAIINGQLGNSYKELSQSILETAKSKAALSKISDLEAKNLDAQFEIDKNNNEKASRINKAQAQYQAQLKNQSPESAAATARGDATYKAAGGFFSTPLGQLKEITKQITEQTNQANLPFAQVLQINNKVEGYLTGYVKTVTKGATDIKNANQLLGENIENFDGLFKNAGSEKDLENIKAALETKLKALTPGDAQITDYQNKLRQIEAAEKQYSPKLTDGNANAESLKNKLALLRELAAANDTIARKALSDDDAALAAVTDRFNQLREKIKAFNADPKNKNNLIPQSELGKLDQAQKTALANQVDLNQNKSIQLDLEKKKQLYSEYQKYREKVGSDIADKGYADLLKSGDSFKDYIDTLQTSLSQQQTDLSPAAFDQRKKLYEKYNIDAQKEQANFNLSALAETLSFEQKSYVIIDNAITKADALRKAGYKEQADLVLKQGEAQLEQLQLQNAETVASYKTLADSLIGVTKEQADLRIQQAKATADSDLASGKITEDTYKKLIDLINQAKATIAGNTIALGLNAIAQALDGISQSAAGLGGSLSSTIGDLSKVFAQVAQLTTNINKLESSVNNYSKNKADAGGGFLGTVSAITNIIPIAGQVISGVIGVVTGVVKFFKAAKETAIQSAQELIRYQNSLVSGEIAYNELLRERAAAIKDINALTAQQLQTQQQLLSLQTSQAQNDFNTLLSQIQSQGQQVTGEHTEKYGGFLGIAKKTKVVQDLAGLGGVDYDQLEKLYTEGKLTDATKTWFEQLQKVHDEMGNIGDATQQVNDQLNQIFTGTTADNLEKAILDGLKAGKRGFADFSADFGASIQDAITSEFESTYLKDKVAAFYADFAKQSQTNGGLTPSEIADLQKEYAGLINDASSAYDNLFKITGQATPSATSKATSNPLTGAIMGITEPQANALEGIDRGIQLAVVKSNDLITSTNNIAQNQLAEMQKQTLVQMQIAVNTKRTADNTDVLPAMRDSLKSIDKNTADSTGAILRGAGIIK